MCYECPKCAARRSNGEELHFVDCPDYMGWIERKHGADIIECAFLVPITEARHQSKIHIVRKMLLETFGGFSQDSQAVHGVWKNPAGLVISDVSYRFVCAVRRDCIGKLRDIVSKLCAAFDQECMYFNVAGRVEFIERGKYLWCDGCDDAADVSEYAHVCR